MKVKGPLLKLYLNWLWRKLCTVQTPWTTGAIVKIAKIAKNRRDWYLELAAKPILQTGSAKTIRTPSQCENLGPFLCDLLRRCGYAYDCLRISAAFALFMCGRGVAEWRRTAISSATIATAISSGVMAPISMPTGA